MSGLEKAKALSPEEVLAVIRESGLRDYGYYADRLVIDLIQDIQEAAGYQNKKIAVAAGLNNADYDDALMEILQKRPDAVLDGMEILCYALQSDQATVYLKERFAACAEPLKEKGLQPKATEQKPGTYVQVETIIDRHVLHHQTYVELVLHFATYEAISKLFETGSVPNQVYLAIRSEGETGALKQYPFGATLGDVLQQEGISLETCKAVLFGHTLYRPEEAAKLVLGEGKLPANGIVEILTNQTCIPDFVSKQIQKVRTESCGKCVFCREGSIQIDTIMRNVISGHGNMDDFELINDLIEAMPYSSICSVGRTAGDAAAGMVRGFLNEVEEHVRRKRCPTDVCKAFMNIYIDPMKCTGCEECLDVCPKNCIEGESGYIHMIDELDCDKCGKCMKVCEEDAIVRAVGRLPKLPDRLTKVGRFKRH